MTSSGSGSVGRASPCQGEGRRFESGRPLGAKPPAKQGVSSFSPAVPRPGRPDARTIASRPVQGRSPPCRSELCQELCQPPGAPADDDDSRSEALSHGGEGLKFLLDVTGWLVDDLGDTLFGVLGDPDAEIVARSGERHVLGEGVGAGFPGGVVGVVEVEAVVAVQGEVASSSGTASITSSRSCPPGSEAVTSAPYISSAPWEVWATPGPAAGRTRSDELWAIVVRRCWSPSRCAGGRHPGDGAGRPDLQPTPTCPRAPSSCSVGLVPSPHRSRRGGSGEVPEPS